MTLARAALAAAAIAGLPLAAQEPLTSATVETLQDGGRLDVPAALAALKLGGEAGRTAAAIVRHEWPLLPAELLDGLGDEPAASALLLRELALAPRPSAASWAESQIARDELPMDVRCYAVAAAARPLRGADADLLIAAAADVDGGDGYRTAAFLLDHDSADRLLGRLHAALLDEGTEFSRLLPFFDRLSGRGYEQLLGLVVSLPPPIRTQLVRYFVQNDVPAFERRAAAALDGEIELEPVWLARAAGLLDEPARVERLLGVIRDQDADFELQQAAFRALLGAEVVAREMLVWTDELEASSRLAVVRKVLDAGVAELPARRIVDWLRDDVRIAQATAAALLRRPVLEPEIEATLRELLGDVVVATPTLPFVMALLYGGSAESVAALWPQLLRSPLFPQFADALARRRAPWGHALLLAELERGADGDGTPARAEQLDAVRLALVALGDRRQLDALVRRARFAEPAFVRRCAHHAEAVGVEHALKLLADAAEVEDEDLAVELIAWAATSRDPAVERELLKLWRPGELDERKLAALHGLAAGSARPRLLASLREAAAAGPLDDGHEAVCYELIATMPAPLSEADVGLLAELALAMPLSDPDRERRRAERWRDGRFGFPLAAAVAHRLRGADPELAHAVFAAAAGRIRAHPDFPALAPQRLLVMWRALVPDPEMQRAIGRATARLLLDATNPTGVGEGPAHLFALEQAELDGELAAAAAHAAAAVARLLRRPSERAAARLFLGERDPAAGIDPWSALAARPFVLQARLQLLAGDRSAAVRELAVARDLAGRDAEAMATIAELTRALSTTKGKQ